MNVTVDGVSVEIPGVDERSLEPLFVITNTVGEVVDSRFDKGEAEARLRELAEGKSAGEYPALFLHEVAAVPTNQTLVQRTLGDPTDESDDDKKKSK